MVDINVLSADFYNELINKVRITDIQILAEHTMYNILQENLSFPRIIHGVTGVFDDDYNYASDYEYNAVDDVLDRTIITVPKVAYRFSIFADDYSASEVFNTINKIHRYFSNDYIKHLDGNIEVINTSSIISSIVEKNDQAIVGWYFTMDFRMEDTMIIQTDYATSIGDVDINLKN